MQVTDVPPEGAPCDTQCVPDDWEHKWVEVCKKDADGNEIAQVTCIPILNGEQGEPSTFWILVDGAIVTEAPEGCTPCVATNFEVISRPVCYEDCTTGYQLIKINTDTDEVTILGSFTEAGLPATESIVKCPEYSIVTNDVCEKS